MKIELLRNCVRCIATTIFFLVMIFYCPTIHAQKIDKDLEKILKKSEVYIRKKQYDKAERYLRYSINKVRDKDIIWDKLGQLSADQKKYAQAVEYYKMAMNFRPQNREAYELVVTKYLILSEQFLEAEYLFYHIIPKTNWSQEKVRLYNQYKKFFSDKNMIYSNMNKEIYVTNVGDAINSNFHEYFPSMSHDDSTMIFTRRFNGVDEDFFIVHKDTCNEQWYSAEHMGYPPNSVKNEGAQCLSYDRHYIFLMRCENNVQSYREAGGCDLYMSYMQDGEWIAPVAFGATINTNSFEGMPTFSSDNKTLYFVSDRPGGYGGKDIWKSEYTKYGWSVPINLGPNINTEKDEISPFIAADNKTLYFSSNGHVGFGGFDIFVSRLDESKKEFTQPINLGIPYNSTYDDISWFLLANGEKAYFASDRPDGYGGMDIYMTNVLPKFRPQPTTFISGLTIDSFSKEIVKNVFVDIYDEKYNLVTSLKSNQGDGSFFVVLEPNRTYKFVTRKYDYPEKEFIYETSIIAHHPPIEFVLELINWSDKKRMEEEALKLEMEKNNQEDSIKTTELQMYEDVEIEIKLDTQ